MFSLRFLRCFALAFALTANVTVTAQVATTHDQEKMSTKIGAVNAQVDPVSAETNQFVDRAVHADVLQVPAQVLGVESAASTRAQAMTGWSPQRLAPVPALQTPPPTTENDSSLSPLPVPLFPVDQSLYPNQNNSVPAVPRSSRSTPTTRVRQRDGATRRAHLRSIKECATSGLTTSECKAKQKADPHRAGNSQLHLRATSTTPASP